MTKVQWTNATGFNIGKCNSINWVSHLTLLALKYLNHVELLLQVQRDLGTFFAYLNVRIKIDKKLCCLYRI